MASAKYQELLERLPQVAKPWKAALYIRLSREDGDKVESNSITSQREILKEYLKLHPDIELHDFYIDDGWSGTNFDRPGFIRMMEDIYSGDVNCVIVKDLSRFGRNYTDAGNYLDNIFVRLQIRFIALNNGIDTATNNMNAATRCITVGVQNVINESLAATTSVNVRGTLNVNREQGKFIGSFASYGYMKDPNDHHKLIIDPETAPVVRMIFEKFIDGCSIIGIAKDLNEMGIPNPTAYKKLKGFNYKHPAGKKLDGLWPDSCFATLAERKTRFYIAVKIPDRRAETMENALVSVLSAFPSQLVKTITCDRGTEFANWRRIEERLHCDVYFADPYCAWQKGTNENLNGLLREFYPKGRNLSRVAPATLKRNLALINARPRKVLNFHSPQELWDFEFISCCT